MRADGSFCRIASTLHFFVLRTNLSPYFAKGEESAAGRVPLVGTGEHSEIENGRPAARRRLRLFFWSLGLLFPYSFNYVSSGPVAKNSFRSLGGQN